MVLCDNLVKIYKTFETEVMALQGLDIAIEEKEVMAIIGNSGSGKSTFLNMIGALDRPTAGKLYVDGKDLFRLNKKEVIDYKRRTVGFVWQSNGRNLISYLTALQNVQLPMMFENNQVKQRRALELLKLMGLEHKKNEYPLMLSGGEQQRVAIAVALANNPKLLLADEPTGAVDLKTSDYIFSVLKEINQVFGTTIIIVTHDMKLASKVNRVAAIRDGKISSELLNKVIHPSEMEQMKDIAEKEEYSILDKAGRVQLPKDMLGAAKITGNRVRIDYREGEIIILPEAAAEK